jgi:hypothetical protein
MADVTARAPSGWLRQASGPILPQATVVALSDGLVPGVTRLRIWRSSPRRPARSMSASAAAYEERSALPPSSIGRGAPAARHPPVGARYQSTSERQHANGKSMIGRTVTYQPCSVTPTIKHASPACKAIRWVRGRRLQDHRCSQQRSPGAICVIAIAEKVTEVLNRHGPTARQVTAGVFAIQRRAEPSRDTSSLL